MQNYDKYIKQIKANLQKHDPFLVLLFGSCVSGNLHKDSDIDLLVVTKDDYMPQTFKEKTELYLKIRGLIEEVNKEVAIDLLVYTLPMYKKFIEMNSSFSREITEKGKIIYESNNTKMA